MNDYGYSVSECPDFIRASDIDEAMVEWLEGDVSDEPLDSLPEVVEVHEWKLKEVKLNSKIFEWGFDTIVDNLDDNYTYEDFCGDYKPSDEVLQAYDKFKEALIKDFTPTILERTGNVQKINLKQWLVDYGWSE